jgi:hypothetical protein
MRKPITLALLLIVPLALFGFAGASQAQLVLYDDFNVKPINPAKWAGNEGNLGLNAPNTEAARKIAGGKLYITLTTQGLGSSNSGTAGISGMRLGTTVPGSQTALQADVTVKSVKVVGCAANTTPTRARAQIVGGFFNDGTSPGSPDRTGDILAGVQSVRDSLLGDRIEVFINRCTNAACTTFTTAASDVFAASWTQGVPNTLGVRWDAANNQFVFNLNPGGPSPETKTLTYAFADSDPPIVSFKHLAVAHSPASCMFPASPGSATMKALFDNMMVNP